MTRTTIIDGTTSGWRMFLLLEGNWVRPIKLNDGEEFNLYQWQDMKECFDDEEEEKGRNWVW